MITLIKSAKSTVINFQIGDKVFFYNNIPERGSYTDTRIVYALVSKVNKVSVDVTTLEGNVYRLDKKKVHMYVDPFLAFNK
jgi:hypothetical protein